ncbi:hypothetical protein L915_13635, partial [Phytophthora nicotianae]
MYSAALFYLVQRGVPTSFADAISRRRLAVSAAMASSGSGSGNTTGARATTDIEVNVPTATALVTVAGCIFIVLLMLCVIYLPTARVKLSPDTTPAAQYVQILTDDLYPDLVHKKRLRFANGDCLLFNEYVIDAIVLHAKRDQTKKIYLNPAFMSPTSPTPANYDHKLRSLTPVERSEAMEQNDISIDSNTIVEVSLRLERFVICVAAALAASGAFLFLMSRKATLKILEGSATYLHNCSLYPGDQPARVHSVLKERGIFWGLKMIIIIMNIGFTSVNINTERKDPSRRLTSSDELETIVMPIKTSWVVDSDAGVLHSILRTSMTGTTTPFAFEDTCKWSKHNDYDAAQQWGAWADDVDTTS